MNILQTRFFVSALTLALAAFVSPSQGANKSSRASGNWADPIWATNNSCTGAAGSGTVPAAGDNIWICPNTTVTIPVALAGAMGTLNVTGSAGNPAVLNVNFASTFGAVTIGNVGTVSIGASSTFTNATINSGGTLSFSGSPILTFNNTAAAALTLNSGGTFSAGAGTVRYIRDGATTIATGTATSIIFNTISLSPTVTGGRAYTLSGGSIVGMTINGNLNGTPAGNNTVAVSVGNLTTAGGGLVVGGTVTLNGSATAAATLNSGNIAMSFGSLVLGGGGNANGFTMANGSPHTLTLTGTSGTLITRNTTSTFTPGTQGTVLVQPSSASDVSLNGGTAGTLTFNNLTVNNPGKTVTLGANIVVNTTSLVSAGTLSNNNFSLTGDGTGTFQVNDGATYAMTGASVFPASFNVYTFQCGAYPTCSTVSYRQTTSPLTLTNQTYGHLELAPSVAATQRFPAVNPFTVNGDLLVGDGTNAATADANTNSVTLDVNGGVNIKATSTLQAHASNSFTVARDWTNAGTFTHNNGTVTFDSTNASTIGGTSTTTFRNRTLNKGAAVSVTASAAFTVTTTLTISNANTTLADRGNTVTVNGAVSNAGTHSGAGKIALTGGAAAHTLSGTGTYGNLELNDANGATVAAAATPTISGTLTLTAGILNSSTNSRTVIASASCPGSIARTAGWIFGTLQLAIPSGTPTCLFPLGDSATNYTPVQVAFTSVTTPGNLTATLVNADHPNTTGTGTASGIGVSTSVNRYWTLKNSTTTAGYSATFTYISGSPVDLDGSVVPANFSIRRGTSCSGAPRNCTSWVGMTVQATPSSTQATATSVTIASGAAESDFVIGQITSTGNFSRERQYIYTREFY